jgi:hypothetical protein
MRRTIVVLLLAVGGVLAVGGEEQKPLGRLEAPSAVMRTHLSCEETYGAGWEKCGDQVCLSHSAMWQTLNCNEE